MTTLSKQQLADIKIHKDAYRHHQELMRGARRHLRYLPYKQKKETRRSLILWCHAVDVAGLLGSLFLFVPLYLYHISAP